MTMPEQPLGDPGTEAAEADTLEQDRDLVEADVDPEASASDPAPGESPDADEADVADQSRDVPIDPDEQ